VSERAEQPRLVWQRPDGSRVDFPLLATPMIVGRDESADIRVDEPLVSRAHARIEPREGGYVVLDLGSTNRTRVNGDVVTERELRHGDEVRFARARCVFLLDPDREMEPLPDGFSGDAGA
jgi:pSer/pThr/pTyr-binding forkhead associated (FHA) protein